MEENNEFIFTNNRFFYQIAKEAFERMKQEFNSGRRPMPNGEPGFIIKYDPDHKSFKAALTSIVFCGTYLESLLHLLIVDKDGLPTYKEYDRKIYEDKLRLLGCNDQSILDECKHFRSARKEIVHEKAHIDISDSYAQDEATRAFNLIETINNHFKIPKD